MKELVVNLRLLPGVVRDLISSFRATWKLRRTRKHCWHHNDKTGESWVKSQLIDTGARKMFWCTLCEKTEIV